MAKVVKNKRKIDVDIMKYIPYGKENAISRKDLSSMIGCSDRVTRDLISHARKNHIIINLSNGKGYYRPLDDDVEDVERYFQQEENRAREIYENLQPVRKYLRRKGC